MADDAQFNPAGRPVYEYRCYDRSLLVPWISRGPATWVHRHVPQGVSANEVTLFGSALLWLAMAGAWLMPSGWRESLAPLWVCALWSYCVLDHVDGQRARAKGTSSALGEFLDHGLDAWNVALVVGLVTMMGPAGLCSPLCVLLLLSATALATIATWLEQHERGAIYLGRLGPVEGVALAGLYVLSWSYPPAARWWTETVEPWSMTRAMLVMELAALAVLSVAVVVGFRLQRARWRLLESALWLGCLCWVAELGWASLPGVLLSLVLSSAKYSCLIIKQHLSHEPLPKIERTGLLLFLLVAVAEHQGLVGRTWELVPLAWLQWRACRLWIKLDFGVAR